MPNQSQNGTTATNGTQSLPRRPSTALTSMLRKTKNKTYSAFRSSSRTADTDTRSKEPTNDVNEELIADVTPKTSGARLPAICFSPPSSRGHVTNVNNLDSTIEEIISSVESTLRKLVICCVVFIAGTIMPNQVERVQKLLEVSIVAWGTCCVIIGMVWYQKLKLGGRESAAAAASAQDVNGVVDPPLIQRRLISTEQTDLAMDDKSDDSTTRKRPYEAMEPTKKITPIKIPREQHTFMPPHLSQLEDLYIMLLDSNPTRLSPNGSTIKIETDLFVGEMLLMFRTSEVDEPPVAEEDGVCEYFRGKQRRFEWQWQLKLKKMFEGEIYVGCELDEPPAMGMIQRALVNTALKFIRKMNQGFGYYFSDTSDSPSYLSFPVGTSMDRFVATKPGDELPKLGKEIYEDPDSMKRRKRGEPIVWNTEDTYTFALWSAYFDWIQWQILNFPGIRPFSATSVAGVQPIKVNLYTIPNTEGKEVASQNPKREVLFALEVSNSGKASLGEEAKAWKANFVNEGAARVLKYDEEASVSENVEDDVEDDNTDDEEEDVEDTEIEALGIEPSIGNLESTIEIGNYVTSGTCLSLREGQASFLASGGGYALLQSSSTSVIVLEKLFRSKKAFSYIQKSGLVSDPQLVIRNGDVVRVKLVNLSSNVTKYLRIHRGWWLRWTSKSPAKTSSFYISTSDPEATALLLGTPFSLRSRKWSSYHVGVCYESSAKYGGRMLAMFKAGKSTVEEEPAMECDEDDEPIDDEEDKDFVAEKPSNNPTMPLLLRAYKTPETIKSSESIEQQKPSPSKRNSKSRVQMESQVEKDQSQLLSMSSELTTLSQYELDCPVWLEVMNRASRITQVVYAVRVKETMSNQSNETSFKGYDRQCSEASEAEAKRESGTDSQEFNSSVYFKLRSGKEIAPTLNLGIRHQHDLSVTEDSFAWQISNLQVDEREDDLTNGFVNSEGFQRANSFSSSSDDSDDEVIEDEPSTFLIAGPDTEVPSNGNDYYAPVFPEKEDATVRAKLIRESSSFSATEEDKPPVDETAEDYNASGLKSLVSNDASGQTDGDDTLNAELSVSETTESKKKGKTKVLNRVAKTVKSSTVITGKQVLKQSKKVGKATVNTGLAAGRAIPNAYKPPKKHEPGGVFSSKKSAKKNSMKHVGRAIKNMEGHYISEMHSGQLNTPDLSKEKISQILHQLSMNKSPAVLDALSSFVRTNSEQDLAFLRGTSAELGVIPLKAIDAEVDHDCICARGIWEGRWREECCVMYGNDNHIAFYAPLSRKPSLVVSFEEIISVRKCDPKRVSSPFPGLPLLSIDTTWRCHYLAFLTDADRENFVVKLNHVMYHAELNCPTKQNFKVAQEWESYKMSLESSLTGSGGKWASVIVGKKGKQKKQRRIFNSRRMAFDLEPVIDYRKMGNDGGSKMGRIAVFVEELLQKALSFTPEALDSTDSSFLDEVSRLRCIPLHEIELDSNEALCIFVNLYHCLLQHALLFAVDGLPDKRTVTRFKRCSCYEIGGDVFSLAELECCVIRGKLSKAVNLKPPFVDAAKKSRPFLQYALDACDNRVNFYVNTGSMDHPSKIPVLRCETLEQQIQATSSFFLMHQVEINVKKRIVTIPKVCDFYRNDFGMGDCLVCLSQLLRFLDETKQLLIASLLEHGGQITIRYKQPSERFHANLTERIDDLNHVSTELCEV